MKQAVDGALPTAFVVVAFTPKGGCRLKLRVEQPHDDIGGDDVAFTPKGGCPLKLRAE